MTKAKELSELGSIITVTNGIATVNSMSVSSNLQISALIANGSIGIAGEVLTTNGSGVYWSAAGVNVNATYTWSNTHTFNANLNILGQTTTNTMLVTSGIIENSNTISSNYTINNNGLSAGPISVANGVTVTVANGAVWTVV